MSEEVVLPLELDVLLQSAAESIQDGIAHQKAGRLDEAAQIYQQILQQHPDDFNALYLAGVVALRQNRLPEAISYLQHTISLKQDHAEAHRKLGDIFKQQKKLEAAIASYQKAIACKPDYHEAHYFLGIVFSQQHNFSEAAFHYQQAIAIKPDYAEAHGNLGAMLFKQDNVTEAIECYRRSLQLNSQNILTLCNLAVALSKQGQVDAAIAHCETAIQIQPHSENAYYNLAHIHQTEGNTEKAIAAYQKVIELNPKYTDAYIGLGNMYVNLCQYDRAISEFEHAIAIEPNSFNAVNWLGFTYLELNRVECAIAAFRSAINYNPAYPEAHINLGIALLLQGNYAEGLEEYEWRSQRSGLDASSPHFFPHPLWDGKDLQGRTLLIYAEQGFGDLIQFIRYIPIVRAMCGTTGKILFDCQDPVKRLFDSITDIEIVPRNLPLPHFDLRISLLSLPWILGTRLDTIPAPEKYLSVAKDINLEATRKISEQQAQLKIGLVWASKQSHSTAPKRSCHLTSLLPLFDLPNIHFCGLQKDISDADRELIAQHHDNLTDLSDDLNDFADTAAIVDRLDLVITVDTSVAHLAGAIGKPVWVMLPFAPDWRWMLEREDSPWYPTMRLFRQQKPGDWQSTIDAVNIALRDRLAETQRKLADTFKQQHKIKEAIAAYQEAIAANPDDYEAHYFLGVLFWERNNLSQAAFHYQRAIAIKPDYAKAHDNLGVLRFKEGKIAEAIQCYRQSLELNSHNVLTLSNIAVALATEGKTDEAIEYCQTAIQMQADRINAPYAHYSFAYVYRMREELEKAIAEFENAIALKPDYADAHKNLAFVLLRIGRIKQGFREYEWRWQSASFQSENPMPSFPHPLWDGTDFPNQTLLICCEQGLGDAIQFIRYISMVRTKGGKLLLDCPKPLQRLFAEIDGIEIAPRNLPLPNFDLRIPLMSLPHIFGTSLATIPASVPYLTIPSAFKSVAAQKISQQSAQLKIGLVWASQPVSSTSPMRSLPLSMYLPLLDIPGIRFYSLQKKVSDTDLPILQQNQHRLENLSDYLEDFADTAAIVAQLDLVISIDTSVVHLAGALGKPVWTLLPSVADWRWMLEREDSPWYPTMRLFRQQQPGDWEGVIDRVQIALSNYLTNWNSIVPHQPLTSLTFMPIDNQNLEQLAAEAIAHYQADRCIAAEELCHKILQQQPQHFTALQILGIIASQTGKIDAGITYLQQALALNPQSAEAHANLGSSYTKQGNLAEAIAHSQLAISLNPEDVGGYFNLGCSYIKQGNLTSAIYCNEIAIALKPDYPEAHYNLSLALLGLGDLKRGFAEFEWLWQCRSYHELKYPVPSYSQPLWDGSNFSNRTLLIYCEYGFGDAIQFSRYLPMVRARGGKILLDFPAPLQRLFTEIEGIEIVPKGLKLPEFDLRISLTRLPYIFGTTLETIPTTVPYLQVPSTPRSAIALEISQQTARLKVGLVWSSKAGHATTPDRSLPLSLYAQLLDIPDIKFYSLQKEVSDTDLPILQQNLHRLENLSAYLSDFATTAAIIASLDLVISVDTSVAHLAGALGKPVWTLLHATPDWRWMREREDSPWYPTMRLFRQQEPGDWKAAIDRVCCALQDYLHQSGSLVLLPQSAHRATRMPTDKQDRLDLEALLKEANRQYQTGNFSESAVICHKVLQHQPQHFNALHLLGVIASQSEKLEAGVIYLKQALDLYPQSAEAHSNIACNYMQQGDLVNAIAHCSQAIALSPDRIDAHYNLGCTYIRQRNYEQAIPHLQKAIALSPNHVLAHSNLSVALLNIGELQQGFAEYEWRWKDKCFQADNPMPPLLEPLWDGTEFPNQTLLIYCEQGLGDAIQFVRYLPMAIAMGGKIVLACYKSLQRLFAEIEGIEIVPMDIPFPNFDLCVPIMSLPRIFGTTLESIPSSVPYLTLPPSSQGEIALEISQQSAQLKVGLVWASKPGHPTTASRSLPLSLYLQLDIPGIKFYSLQKEISDTDQEIVQQHRHRLENLSNYMVDFASTAAIVEQLDLVISIDTAVAHLAGALGKPTWVLLPFDSDWRWMLEREDSPWYPTMRLFRQPQPGDWSGVIAQVNSALHDYLTNRIATEEYVLPSVDKLHLDALLKEAIAHHKAGKISEAETLYHKILQDQPQHFAALHLLGVSASQSNQLEAGVAYIKKALEINPHNAEAHSNLAIALLTIGDLQNGFREYEWRWKNPAFQAQHPTLTFSQPRWDGSPFEGKTLLIHCEQGFGDAIQFSRYISLVKARGNKILVDCPEPLRRLFAVINGIAIAEANNPLTDFDLHISLMSLPHIFGTDLGTIPAQVPYLSVPDLVKATIHLDTFNKPNNLKVGLMWSSKPSKSGEKRSCPLTELSPLLAIPGVNFYSLQKELSDRDREIFAQLLQQYPHKIQDLSNCLSDFADTAVIVEQLDLVISIDTAVAHLAGALGKPTWILLPFVSDWRWMLEREDSPWYPTVRLFRQQQPGDWSELIDRVTKALIALVAPMPRQSSGKPHNTTQIGIGWPIGSPTGWGTFGLNLALQILTTKEFKPFLLVESGRGEGFANPLHQKLFESAIVKQQEIQKIIAQNPGKIIQLDIPILHALSNSTLKSTQPHLKGKYNFGYIFFESGYFSTEAINTARDYDLIFAGSQWNADKLKSYGLTNICPLIQGIDPTIFHPAPRSNLFGDRFVIFSGGKLEYRKGQDIVVAAFRIFQTRHPDALLLTAWHNFWPQFMQGIDQSSNVVGVPTVGTMGKLEITKWLVDNGLPVESFIDLGLIPNHITPQIIREADVALFPNRCEGGTNLVAMECLACGIPTILSANTGHLDLISDRHCYPLRDQKPAMTHPLFSSVEDWGESNIEEIVEILEDIYANRDRAKRKGQVAAVFMQDLTWEKQVKRLLQIVSPII